MTGTDVVGETIGSYRIIKQLGAGAMGQVYLAEHRHLKRQAALKLLARELMDRPELLERFFLEARATSAIAHPGIVQILDCEIDATGRPYIVMELLTGDTLAALLARKGALMPLTVARLVRTLAEGLEAAHAKGIVHRDIKPENMFVLTDPPDSIKLVDFGIAKLAGELQANQVHKTRSGAVMGTPMYMSPEQCRDSASIDFRTDLYSLGCVMHEMLTGHPPFLRDNFGDLMVAHLTEPPPDPRALNPAVPAALAELTGELLRKDPASRPASMRVVAERLMTYVARMTTVPGSAASASAPTGAATGPSAAAAAPPLLRSTFGGSAAEVAGGAGSATRPRRRATPIVVGVALIAVVGVAASFALRGGSTVKDGAPKAAAPVAPAAPVAIAAPTRTAPPPSSATATALPAGNEDREASVKRGSTTSKPSGARRTAGAPGRRVPADEPNAQPATARAAEPTPPKAAAADLSGAWEGPWTDAAHGQHGRLFLQLAGGGQVAGWMTNTSARQSYQMVGTVSPTGSLDLACRCPPEQQFVARGAVRADAAGELRGELSLASPAGVFGQSHLTLHRTTATH